MATRPPLNAVFVFCTAARCGNFKLAAQELCVTPGAVSRQIQALEEHLGLTLFDRTPRAVRLTRKGQQLHGRVADKMTSIAAEIELLRSGDRRTVVRVDSGVTLAMHWLIPRLTSFSEAHPDIQVQISTSDGPIEAAKAIDLHIRRDPAEFRGLKAQVFLEEHSVLVASPKPGRGKTTLTLRGMKRCPRIGARSRPDLWKQWSAYHGLDASDFEPTLEFDNTVLAIQAAAEGLGAMVVPEMFVTSMIDSHLLTLVDPARVPTGFYSYVTRTRRDSSRVRRFTDWLTAVKTPEGRRPD